MNLLSFSFAGFLLVSLILYYLCPKKIQWVILFASNLFFYACSGVGNFVFILASSLITFYGAVLVSKLNDGLKEKKPLLSKEDFKYRYYIQKQDARVARLHKMENAKIPSDFDYGSIPSLSAERDGMLP